MVLGQSRDPIAADREMARRSDSVAESAAGAQSRFRRGCGGCFSTRYTPSGSTRSRWSLTGAPRDTTISPATDCQPTAVALNRYAPGTALCKSNRPDWPRRKLRMVVATALCGQAPAAEQTLPLSVEGVAFTVVSKICSVGEMRKPANGPVGIRRHSGTDRWTQAMPSDVNTVAMANLADRRRH